MTVSDKYRKMSKEQLLGAVYQLGADYEGYSGSCSQCTVAALRDVLGFEDIIVKIATSSCGGQAVKSVGTCGAVIGGTIVLDYYFGRNASNVSNKESIPLGKGEMANAMVIAGLLCDKYNKEYGSILCPRIQETIFGRSFNLSSPEDWQEFEKAGAHDDPSKCMSVVGNAARWTLEILLDEGAVELE
jgi:C_GCAxxG_C_C family probable redox protein